MTIANWRLSAVGCSTEEVDGPRSWAAAFSWSRGLGLEGREAEFFLPCRHVPPAVQRRLGQAKS